MENDRRGRVQVAHLQRGAYTGGFSLERIFDDIRGALPPDIEVDLWVNSRPNRGAGPRLSAALGARKGRHDVKHVLGDAYFLTWFLPPERTLLTILDCVSLKRLSGWRRAAFKLLWYSWPLSRARHVTTLSEFVRQELVRSFGYPAGRISVIPPAVSPEFQYCAPRAHKEWRRVLQIGSSAVKNRPRVIEALAGLDITLVTVGAVSPSEEAMIAARGISHEAHKDLSRGELYELYKSVDILLFPSTYEGFGMPIVEAQTVGRPVVTSRIAPMTEVSGGAAVLVDPLDVASIRAGILKVLEDERLAEELIRSGVDNARKYRVDQAADQYARLYREIAGS